MTVKRAGETPVNASDDTTKVVDQITTAATCAIRAIDRDMAIIVSCTPPDARQGSMT